MILFGIFAHGGVGSPAEDSNVSSEACESSIRFFPEEIPAGLITISRYGYAVKANREMASFALQEEG